VKLLNLVLVIKGKLNYKYLTTSDWNIIEFVDPIYSDDDKNELNKTIYSI
jgi:hypothetical protein